MPPKTPKPNGTFTYCVGSNPPFTPEEYASDPARRQRALDHLAKNDLYAATVVTFNLPERDTYVYHAMTAVRLAEVQRVVSMGGVNGLHAWYRDEEGKPLDPPPQADIQSYIQIFSPKTSTPQALKSHLANAKKSSLRALSAAHLLAHRYIHPSLPHLAAIPKCKNPQTSLPPNPSLDFWSWSALSLQYLGPLPSQPLQSHHVLPILMHHFGCATPSHEALSILRLLAGPRPIADIGSGNGYWTHMLRLYNLTVYPVDNLQSEWRTNWVPDTIPSDGVSFLKSHAGGKDMVMLLVYPVVGGSVAGGTEGSFTRGLVDAYEGDTIAVVGTQNGNGYTGFRGMTMAEYMAKEQPEWVRVVQIPLPSFAGKDEALFVFQRGERAPPRDEALGKENEGGQGCVDVGK
ncbi:hypothetical protein JMJ77_0005564 [Colletotrichum scovillei]|uniref:Uncharacterized protein n=1 Tax=Colletotrichum scovillei TaxID=1209932 RepID=A0A9P7RGZ3_9PEZI|nr:hypothetical protein JMJ77_0005564 [Colletotrichum scovillei]KAG7076786.1 hypothetical protein JMJ76_0014045 [Colletotrichum scovillei]KAG7083788.1 hypothetical protein JMJ78_0009230 [Colletotrichum scovillei]